MSRFADVQAFVQEANRVPDMASLENLLEGTSRTLGFDYYALLHHVSRRTAGADAIRLTCYPMNWQEIIAERGYLAEDPVCAASEKSVAAFTWSELSGIIELTPRQHELMAAAEEAGLGDGFTVPVHIPGEYNGSCGFSVKSGRELPTDAFPAAQYVGCFAFEAARRVSRKGRNPRCDDEFQAPRLTQRQLDCVVQAARGKSDWDAGRLLGISHQTVHKHIEEAKRRFGVATRTQLVIRALFGGHLTFGDVLN